MCGSPVRGSRSSFSTDGDFPGTRIAARCLGGGHGPAAGGLLRSATTRGGVESLWRSGRWFLGKPEDEVLTKVAATGMPRADLWAEDVSLIPLGIGVKAAKLLDCDLTV